MCCPRGGDKSVGQGDIDAHLVPYIFVHQAHLLKHCILLQLVFTSALGSRAISFGSKEFFEILDSIDLVDPLELSLLKCQMGKPFNSFCCFSRMDPDVRVLVKRLVGLCEF